MKLLLSLLLLLNGIMAAGDTMGKAAMNAALVRAVAVGDTEKAAERLRHGASVNALTPLGQTPLEVAVEYGHYGVAQLLMCEGANVNAESSFGTPLVWASERGSVSLVRLLLDHQANPNHSIPLDVAILCSVGAREQNEGPSSMLTRVSPNTPANRRLAGQMEQKLAEQMSLQYVGFAPGAVERKRLHGIEIMRLLLAHGANVNAKQDDGATPLMEAVRVGTLQSIQLLLDAGADVNVQDNEGVTALYSAVVNRNVDAVRLLLRRGAKPSLKLKDGRTALDMAKGMQNSETITLLERAGAK